jgi:hypothetical protein
MLFLIAGLVGNKEFATHVLQLLVYFFPDLGRIATVEMLIPFFTTNKVVCPSADSMAEIITPETCF